MKLVEFNMVVREQEGEDDALEAVTRTVFVNPETVRSIRARTEGRGAGTRIEFPNSAALVVAEGLAAVKVALLA